MVSNHPTATAIPSTAPTTLTVGRVTSTKCTSVLPVHVVGLNQTVTATMVLARTAMEVPATSTKRTLGLRARVLVGLNHPSATVTRLHVPTTHMMVLVTSTGGMLVVPVHAMELDQTVTAIPPLAQVTRILGPATSTKCTSDRLARVLMALNYTTATAIRISVLITHTLVLATSAESTLVHTVHALELDQAGTATTLHAQVTRTAETAISTEAMSAVTVTAVE